MFLDFLSILYRSLLYTATTLAVLFGLLFMVAHIIDTWDAPIYPHSGFSPECPSWEPPTQPENTLPPSDN